MPTPIAGSDGIVPIYEPEGRWTTWGYHEIWQGKEGQGKYVPKLHDYVVDYATDKRYRVVGHDDKLIPRLSRIIPTQERVENEVDNLLRSGRRTSPDSYRVYLDTSVNPHRLSVDARFSVGGSTNTHAQIFRGYDIGQTGEVISNTFDHTGQLLSTLVPLELKEQSGMKNHTAKVVPPCFTTVKMPDDEIVTVVIYDDQGVQRSIQEFYVYNTSAIRQTDTAQKYVTDISLESVFMSESDPSLLAYPLNVNVSGLNLFGVVHYSDGSTKRYPVDGTKFSVLGLADYVSTMIGYENEFTLKYILSKGESAVGTAAVVPGAQPNFMTNSHLGQHFITKRYQAKVVEPDGSYNVKLYGYPVWIDQNVGYRLEWFLLNLERSQWRRVTPHVRFNTQTNDTFDGKLYGVNQRLSVSIDLKQVHGTYKQYIHTQVIDITLQRHATDQTAYRWSVGFEINQEVQYGIDLWAKVQNINANLKRLDISQSETKLDTWLKRMWRQTKPMYDPMREASAPEPDHFTLVIGQQEFTYPISQWNTLIEFNQPIRNTDNIYVVFLRRTNTTDLFVGISALPVFIL